LNTARAIYPYSRTNVTASTYNVIISDNYLGVTNTYPVIINLLTGHTGNGIVIKDERGLASTNAIVINANGGDTIDNQSNIAISTNYGSVTLWFNNGWHSI